MRAIVVVLASIVVLSASSVTAQQRPVIAPSVELGTFGSLSPFPSAINNRGDVVGSASGIGGSVAFLWTRRDGFQLIASRASAVDINDRGQVIGQFTECNPSGACVSSAYLWSERQGFIDLGRFTPTAINNRGEIAGVCSDPVRACVWRRGVVRPIAGPNTYAAGINDKGDIAGGTFDLEGALNAFVVTRNGKLIDLGPGVARDINNQGIVSGWLSGIDSSAAVWVNGELRELGGEPSSTSGINDSGWVLVNGEGFARASNVRRRTGVSLAPEGGAEAIAINNRGEIVGFADGSDGTARTVIWRLHGRR